MKNMLKIIFLFLTVATIFCSGIYFGKNQKQWPSIKDTEKSRSEALAVEMELHIKILENLHQNNIQKAKNITEDFIDLNLCNLAAYKVSHNYLPSNDIVKAVKTVYEYRKKTNHDIKSSLSSCVNTAFMIYSSGPASFNRRN
jgi:hypothetical protein